MVEVTLVVVSVEMAGIALEPSQVEMETVTTAVLVMVVPKALQDNLVVGVVAVRVVLVLQAVALDKVVPVAAGVVAVAVEERATVVEARRTSGSYYQADSARH